MRPIRREIVVLLVVVPIWIWTLPVQIPLGVIFCGLGARPARAVLRSLGVSHT